MRQIEWMQLQVCHVNVQINLHVYTNRILRRLHVFEQAICLYVLLFKTVRIGKTYAVKSQHLGLNQTMQRIKCLQTGSCYGHQAQTAVADFGIPN